MVGVEVEARKPFVLSSSILEKTVDKSVCSHCKLRVEENDKGMKCDVCTRWYHIDCDGVSHEKYVAFTKLQRVNKQFHWFSVSLGLTKNTCFCFNIVIN